MTSKEKSVRVKVLSGRNFGSKINAYVKLATSLGECKTTTMDKCEAAEWNETFTIICSGPTDTLSVTLREEKTLRNKDIGSVEIALKKLQPGANVAWHRLDGAGEVQLHLTPNGFSGLNRSGGVPVSEKELNDRFAEVIKNVAGTNETQRDAMMNMPAEMKWNMIKQHEKKAATGAGRIEDRPETWAQRLQAEPNQKTLAELRVLLSCQPLSWLERFVQLDGIVLLVALLGTIEKKALNHIDDRRFRHEPEDLVIETECVRCLRMLMNNEVGLRAVLHTPNSVKNLCLALDSVGMEPRVKGTILKLLTVTCMMPPDGHRILLQAMNEYKNIKNEKHRFQGLLKSLKKATTVDQKLGYMYLINALINSPPDIDLRIAIRNEFNRLGISDIISRLKEAGDAELELQIDVFEEETTLDAHEVQDRFQHLDVDVDDCDEVFQAVRTMLKDTGLSETLLSILRNLLLVPANSVEGQKLWLLVARFVRQISVQREAIGATDDNEIKLDVLLTTVEDDAGMMDKAAALEKAQNELKELRAKNKQLTSESEDQMELLKAKDAILRELAATGKLPEGVKLDGSISTLGSTAEVSSPGGDAGDAPITGGPPPPPMMGDGGDAPVTGGPPPPPMMGGAKVGGGPPPPPPPMMMKKFKWKLTPAPKTKLKGFQWNKLPDKVADKTIFKKFQEAPLDGFKFDWRELESDFAVKKLAAKGAATMASKASESTGTANLLDGKISQNLSIWLSQYKELSHTQICKNLLALDTSTFSAASIKTLLSTLPGADGEAVIKDYLTGGGDAKRLGTPEKFTLELAKVPNVEGLLGAFLFLLEFDSLKADIRPGVEAVRLASREVFASKRFARLLQVVMWLGNYMNGSTPRGDAPGFRLDSLNKIGDTKTTDNKRTLLNYLVRQIHQQDPDLCKWADDLKNVYAASRVALPQLNMDLTQLKNGARAARATKDAMPSEHRKLHSKLEAFLLRADGEVQKMSGDLEKMVKGYEKMTEQFAVDGKKILPDEFFGVLQTFAENFKNEEKRIELDADRMAKEEKRNAAKQAKLNEFKRKKEELAAARKKGKKGDDAAADDDADEPASGANESMFEKMMGSLQAGEAFAERRKAKPAKASSSSSKKKRSKKSRAADMD